MVLKNASEFECYEIRKAFYAGAGALMMMQDHLFDKHDVETNGRLIAKWHEEMENFIKEMIAVKAAKEQKH